MTFGSFFNMGGHALYVWLSYGAAGAVLGGLWIASRMSLRRLRREIETLKADASQ